MSSSDYSRILSNALGIVEVRCRHLDGCEAVVAQIASLADSIRNDVPMYPVGLVPSHLSQALDVPIETVMSVVAELKGLGVVHQWLRVRCPNSADIDSVRLETDSPDQLRELLESPCECCGQLHRLLDWDHVDVFYALNRSEEVATFPFGAFFLDRQRAAAN